MWYARASRSLETGPRCATFGCRDVGQNLLWPRPQHAGFFQFKLGTPGVPEYHSLAAVGSTASGPQSLTVLGVSQDGQRGVLHVNDEAFELQAQTLQARPWQVPAGTQVLWVHGNTYVGERAYPSGRRYVTGQLNTPRRRGKSFRSTSRDGRLHPFLPRKTVTPC